MTRILFYLPNVTPWWFEQIITPLVKLLARDCDVHVMVPPFWRGTGITEWHLGPFLDGPEVTWHILDDDSHPALRTSATGDGALLDLITSIDADYTLCRSADPEVMHAFPGVVRYIMEGVAPLLRNGGAPVIFPSRLFEHGAMSPLAEDQLAQLDAAFAEIWAMLGEKIARQTPPSWRIAAGVAPERKVVALALEYEFEDTFTGPHRTFVDNRGLIAHVAERLDDDIFLAITNHPLNDLYVDPAPVEALVAALGDRAAIIRSDDEAINATDLVARDCDGAIVELSKSHIVYAYFNVPMLRLASSATAPWLNAATDIDAFSAAIRDGTAQPPSIDATRRWFAHHIANSALDVADPELTSEMVIDHFRRPSNPARWDRNLARFARQLRQHEHA